MIYLLTPFVIFIYIQYVKCSIYIFLHKHSLFFFVKYYKFALSISKFKATES